jgi:hypothetical protein
MSLADFYVCGKCDYKTKITKEMDDHWRTPEHLKHYEHLRCDTCEIQFFAKVKFQAHLETSKHKRLSNIIMNCELCGYMTTSKQLMNQHKSSQKHANAVNGVKPPIYECLDCNLRTKYKSVYEQHMNTKKHRVGFNDQIYECTTCDYKCGSKQLIDQHNSTKKHMNAVAGVLKPEYECIPCNFKSKFKSKLDEHLERKNHKKTVLVAKTDL